MTRRHAIALTATLPSLAAARAAETWRIDNLSRIGGHQATVLGHPKTIAAPGGKAVEFNGVDDAIFLDVHPLAGAETWTWEVIFRPDLGGAPEQRFFHLQENASSGETVGKLTSFSRSSV